MSEIQHGFFRHGDNAYLANFTEAEREVLVNLTEQIIELLKEKINVVSFDNLKEDVVRFIKDDKALQIWSPAYFSDLIEKLKFL